jgi:hypothetical protein
MAVWMRRNLTESEAVAVRGEIGTVTFYSRRVMVNEFSDMTLADALIEEAGYERAPVVGPLVRLNFLWRRDRAPLPTPTYEFVPVPVPGAGGPPQCSPEDPACRMTREGSTEWVGRMWFVVRWTGVPPEPLPPPPGTQSASEPQAPDAVGGG